MAKTITNHPGGATTTKYDSLEELQKWAKDNVDNPYTLRAIMAPIVIPIPKQTQTVGPGVPNEPPVIQIGA